MKVSGSDENQAVQDICVRLQLWAELSYKFAFIREKGSVVCRP